MFLSSFLLSLTLIIMTLCATTIQPAPNFEASMLVFYNSSGTSMPNQTFVRSFSTAFATTPVFAFGINNYKLRDQFYYQNFGSYQDGFNGTVFKIKVVSVSSTNVSLFSISYIATTLDYFSADYREFTSATNISSGSGDRYLLIYYSKSFNSTNVLALPFLTGYYITSSNYFMVNTTASVISNFNYELKILTTSDCLLLRVSLFVLFCDTSTLASDGYYYKGGKEIVYSNDVNNSSFTTEVTNYGQAQFLLGLRGFDGFTVLGGCYWGWQVSSANSTTATLLIYKNQLQNIYFSFLQFGKEVTSNPVTPVNPTDPVEVTPSEGGSSLGIIAGLIVGIIVVAVLIAAFLKYYWRRVKYDPPKNDFFKEMPSLTL